MRVVQGGDVMLRAQQVTEKSDKMDKPEEVFRRQIFEPTSKNLKWKGKEGSC